MSIDLLSYNIHRCYGRDGQYNPQRIKQVLKNSGASIIALQEVELLEKGQDILEYFCEDSPWQAIPGLTMSRQSGHYGNALLTSLPIVDIKRIDLSQPGREPRGAIQVKVRYQDLDLDVTTTHLGLRAAERFKQINYLISMLEHNPFADIQILLGDINVWLPWSKTLRVVLKHFRHAPAAASYPAGFPLLALDRIWITPNSQFKYIKTIKNPLTHISSDHLPLLARLDV